MSQTDPEASSHDDNPYDATVVFCELVIAQTNGNFETAAAKRRELERLGYSFEYRHPRTPGPAARRAATKRQRTRQAATT